MAEVFTLSGAADGFDVIEQAARGLGYGLGYGFGAACQEKQNKFVVTSKAAKVAGAGASLYGAYKLGQEKPLMGVLAMVIGVGLWFSGGRLFGYSQTICTGEKP